MFHGWITALATPGGLREGDDVKVNPFRVCEGKLVSTTNDKAITLVGNAILAPCAEPISPGIANVLQSTWGMPGRNRDGANSV